MFPPVHTILVLAPILQLCGTSKYSITVWHKLPPWDSAKRNNNRKFFFTFFQSFNRQSLSRQQNGRSRDASGRIERSREGNAWRTSSE
ncbi:hypothetical protein B0I72DRAFT_138913 [Yarrowia lipolytica]|uniref:Secreted protein n=1 Tax=Yarrowia lipolytica TaxID=4952 RepID=A0A371C822_YARLL|nr:hypothetical protein BKA91DRAFT_139644 [Yarrowia lipolytica]KAE8170394.1 hypothetical protein BKA90DRAFT_140855 [Yarrowia lipolytica]RDW26332.1 hypothetical protein B0I71DRAFT_131094 [Yarrowia lipolytica]RDW31930.1 hypothetical protein B0I72DRAFT_138913 [Yarrowia lipolytica]RDW38497.1 hypothetical protein B0I73DRAFT_133616 [Yarrowia lipolytica]